MSPLNNLSLLRSASAVPIDGELITIARRRGTVRSGLLFLALSIATYVCVHRGMDQDSNLLPEVVPILAAQVLAAAAFLLPWPDAEAKDFVVVREISSPMFLETFWCALWIEAYIGSQQWQLQSIRGISLIFISSAMVICATSVQLGWLVYKIQGRGKFSGANIICIILYYLAGLCVVSTYFANIYFASENMAGKTLDVVTPIDKFGALSNRMAIENQVRPLLLLDRDASRVLLDVSFPAELGPDKERRLQDSVSAMLYDLHVVEQFQMDKRGARFLRDHSLYEDLNRAPKVLLHFESSRDAFSSSSGNYWDAFYMSAITMVTMGLSETYPVGIDMKAAVVFEQLTGILYFVVLLGGITNASSKSP
jgi:hypothetical protein